MQSASAPPAIDSRSAAAAPRTTQALIHALNNQLTVVLGAAEWAADSDDPARLRCALALVVRSSSEMARLLREFPHDACRSAEARTEVGR